MQAETDTQQTLDVIPSLSMEIPKRDWDSSCSLLDADAAILPQLRAKIESLRGKVVDQSSYDEMGAALTQVLLIEKAPDNRLGWVDTIIKRARGLYDQARNRVRNECTALKDMAKTEMKIYERREIPAAKADEAQENKRRAKEGLPSITVAPAISRIPGYRPSITYKATFDTPADFDKFLNAWSRAKGERKAYLRKFLSWDEKALNREAREEIKDPKKMAALIPGCRAWSE